MYNNGVVDFSTGTHISVQPSVTEIQSEIKEIKKAITSLFFLYFFKTNLATCNEWPFKRRQCDADKRSEVVHIYSRLITLDAFTETSWNMVSLRATFGFISTCGTLYSSLPVIHLALSTPDPFCFPSVWPIVTESNCRQKTTSNDYFIWESKREWKVTDRYFQQKEEAFLFPTHNFRQQRILLTWLRLEHQNKWQSTGRGQSAQREKGSLEKPGAKRLLLYFC